MDLMLVCAKRGNHGCDLGMMVNQLWFTRNLIMRDYAQYGRYKLDLYVTTKTGSKPSRFVATVGNFTKWAFTDLLLELVKHMDRERTQCKHVIHRESESGRKNCVPSLNNQPLTKRYRKLNL
jgi:hypothetical protein